MNIREALAARLIAPLKDEGEVETRPLEDIGADLRYLGIDPTASIAKAEELALAQRSPAADALTDPKREAARADRCRGSAQRAASRRDWLSPAAVVGILRLSDAAVVLLAALAAWFTRFDGREPVIEPYLAILAVLLTLNVFQFADLYKFDRLTDLFSQLRQLLPAWATVIAGLLVIGFTLKVTSLTIPLNFERSIIHATSRIWVGLWFFYGLFGLFVVRLLFSWRIHRWQAAGRLVRHIVVLGAGEHGRQLVDQLLKHGEGSVRLAGIFDDRTSDRVPAAICGIPVLGRVTDLVKFVRSNAIDQVVVALPWHAGARMLAWLQELRGLPVDVSFCPDATGPYVPQGQILQVAGVSMLNLKEKPLSGWNYIVKSTEDRALAALILVVLLPILLLIALLIKLESRGPVLVRRKRFGFDGQPVEFYAFRTAYLEHDGQGSLETARHSRPTAFGRILRQSSLDELPQFIDMFMGNISSASPTPHAVERS